MTGILLLLPLLLVGSDAVRTAVDSTPASRRLSAALNELWAEQQAEALSVRLQFGLPIEHLPDISSAHTTRSARRSAQMASKLRAIPDAGLSDEERVSKEAVIWAMAADTEMAQFYWHNFGFITPYTSELATVARAFATAPVATTGDRTRYLALLGELPGFIDSLRAGLVDRARRNLTLPREELPLVVDVIRGFQPSDRPSPFLVAPERLAQVDSVQARVFSVRTGDLVRDRVDPALTRLLDYLGGPYAKLVRPNVGAGNLPGGRAYYRFLVRYHTTLNTTPEAVHKIGLDAVAQAESSMAIIRQQLGFKGTKTEFHRQLRTDPKFFAKTPEEVGERLIAHDRRIRPFVERFFKRVPRAQGDVRRLDPRLEGSQTFGYYRPPTAGDSMGHYFYNASKLPERSLLNGAALVYHELIPGHHFQINLALENMALHPYRRNTYYTAYGEGWGEYASRLGVEMGAYPDPYDRYGRLSMEMFLACRLVVDTGMNYLGWTRQQALDYLTEHTLESPTQLATETLRYSADMPGQALGYKMGARELQQLRSRAQDGLGARFDVRDFHDVVLSSGMVPMTVLGAKVDRYIAATKGSKATGR